MKTVFIITLLNYKMVEDHILRTKNGEEYKKVHATYGPNSPELKALGEKLRNERLARQNEKGTKPNKTFGGVFATTKEAKEYITIVGANHDECGYYTWAVIEELSLDGWILPVSESWYYWDEPTDSFRESDKPYWAEGIVAWLG